MNKNNVDVKYKKLSAFNRGILFELLKDAYSFDIRYERCWRANWKECDDFFFDHLDIADKYCFITTLNNQPIGFICWDPRDMPKHVEIGHNCILVKYKGSGYGKMQLQEATNRIVKSGTNKIIVTTNSNLVPAQRNYESVGFVVCNRRKNETESDFAGEYIDYEYVL